MNYIDPLGLLTDSVTSSYNSSMAAGNFAQAAEIAKIMGNKALLAAALAAAAGKSDEECENGNNPDYPGDDPTQAPEGYEWKGRPGSKPGDKEGNYHNPETGESFRPDLDHDEPVGPHWDYKDPNGDWHRVHPDGSVIPK